MSNNSVSTIFLDCRDDLNKLRLLDLRYNKIRRLQHHDIMFTSPNAPRLFPVKNTVDRILHPRLNNNDPPSAPSPPLIVDLRGNLIRSVDIRSNKVKKIFLDRNGTIPEGIYGHATILLDDNPFSCDCSMLNFLRIVQRDVAPVSTPQFLTGQIWIMPARIEVGNLSCWEPKSIRGSLISEPETWIHHILPLISLCSL
ncbi:hypothetical protein J437_LFUL000127 [Ladona fulva]|uniref:Uncharacterized protein n=1 Tax=Ladona fulva TaxID=123851 RepID=A0A8K0NXI7_LADFU|nr:hypothetical protein J437_LFUL000127 [Ladona fulva]